MTRKSLCREIQSVSQRLNVRQQRIQLVNTEVTASLKKINPYVTIGIGLLAGVVTSVLGWRKAYLLVSVSASVYPFFIESQQSLDEYA